jgi:hypothetical protein
MNFSPESGYDTALRILTRYGLPIREKTGRDEPPSSLYPRNFASSPSQDIQHFTRLTIPSGASVIPHPPQYSNNQFEQGSANSVFSRNHSFAQAHPTSDVPSVFTDSKSRIHTSDGRLENHTIPASGYGPYEARLEPTRHPQYAPVNPAHPEMLDGMDPDSARPFTAPVSLEPRSKETLSQLLPPKRELPFAKPAPKEVRRDFPTAGVSLNVPESAKSNDEENVIIMDNAPPKTEASEKKGATMRMNPASKIATPEKKAASKKKATPRKTITPKKKVAPKKKANPKAKAPAKSKKDTDNRNNMAPEVRESTLSKRPLDLTATHRTESSSESCLLLADASVIPQNAALATQYHEIISDLAEIHRSDSGNMQPSATPQVSITKVHPAHSMSSEYPVATAEWIKQVNRFMEEGKEHLEQANVPSEPRLLTPEWMNQIDEFIRESKSHFRQAKVASEYPLVTAEWMEQVNSFMKEGSGQFLMVEMLSAAPLVTEEWINRVDEFMTRQNDLSVLVDRFMSKTQGFLEQNSQILKQHQNCTCLAFSPDSGKHLTSQTSRLRTPKPQETSQVKSSGKRRLGSDYSLTPAARNPKRLRINPVQPPHPALKCKEANASSKRLPRLGPEFEW